MSAVKRIARVCLATADRHRPQPYRTWMHHWYSLEKTIPLRHIIEIVHMNIKNIIAVSGLSGLYKLVLSKNNGLIVADPDTGKTRFCSIRQHQFTPMETVAIYTEEDTVEIATVFQAMLDQAEKNPVPSANASHTELSKYFAIIIPDYDRERVYHSDMKKVIKWYNYLNERGYLTMPAPEPDEEGKTEATETEK
jgi:hypothetical protein